MTNPFLTQRQHVAVKAEVTEGTDSVPADVDVIHPVFGVEWDPDVEMAEREVVQDSFSRIKSIAGERTATITFSTEMKGSGVLGTAPSHLSAPLQGAAFGETIDPGVSVTYAPVSASIPSMTVELREGSTDNTVKIKKILGARANVTFEGEKGGIFLANFVFTGVYVEPTEGATQFTTPAITVDPEPFLNAGLSFHGVSTVKLENVTIDMANIMAPRNNVTAATGNDSVLITGRVPVGTIDPEIDDIATINFFNRWTQNTEGALTFNLGASAGNVTTFTMPATQILDVSEDDREGIRVESIDLKLNGSVAAGNDELSIVFT